MGVDGLCARCFMVRLWPTVLAIHRKRTVNSTVGPSAPEPEPSHRPSPSLAPQVRNAASLLFTALLVRVLGFRNHAGKVGCPQRWASCL